MIRQYEIEFLLQHFFQKRILFVICLVSSIMENISWACFCLYIIVVAQYHHKYIKNRILSCTDTISVTVSQCNAGKSLISFIKDCFQDNNDNGRSTFKKIHESYDVWSIWIFGKHGLLSSFAGAASSEGKQCQAASLLFAGDRGKKLLEDIAGVHLRSNYTNMTCYCILFYHYL